LTGRKELVEPSGSHPPRQFRGFGKERLIVRAPGDDDFVFEVHLIIGQRCGLEALNNEMLKLL